MKLKSYLLAVGLVLCAASISMAEAEITGDATIGVYNKYIWRGYDLSGNANFLIQPEATIDINGLSLSVWGNYNEASEKLDETDLTIEYSHEINEQLSARAGHILYSMADTADTAEVFAGVTLNLPIEIDLEAAYDYDELEEWFLTLGVSKTVELADNLGLNLGAKVGYNDFDYLNQSELSASIDYSATEKITITPSLLYSAPLSQEAKDEEINDEVVTSLSVTYSF